MDNWSALFDGQTRYTLEINDSPFTPDVLRFQGREALSEPFCWTIDFTTPQNPVAPEQVLMKQVSEEVCEAVQMILEKGPDAAMNVYNGRKVEKA